MTLSAIRSLRGIVVVAAAALLVARAPAMAQCQEPTQLVSPGNAQGVAISGDLMVVRGFRDLRPVLRAFRREGSAWVETDLFHLTTTGGPDLSGDRVIIGRAETDPLHVPVLRRAGGSWVVEAELAPDSPEGHFGADVAIDEARAIVGQPTEDGGRAHLYRRAGDRWIADGVLAPPTSDLRRFGARVAIDGNTAAVSSVLPDDDGLICIYRRRGEWRLEDEIIVPLRKGLTSDVDLDGNRLIASVGNPARPAHIYIRRGGAWSLESRLADGGRWGWVWDDAYVALSGDRALVGRIAHDDSVDMRGVGYSYIFDGQEWVKDRTLTHTASPVSTLTGAAIGGETAALVSSGRPRLYHLTLAPGSCPERSRDLTNGLRIRSGSMLTPQTPLAPVVIEAFTYHATGGFAASHFDALASESGWENPRLTSAAMGVSGLTPGAQEGPLIRDVFAGQRFLGYRRDPVEAWEADFATTDFTPRRISLGVRIYQFAAYRDALPLPWSFRTTGVVDPVATIRVWRSSCLADCDGSGELDIFDFLCFQELFAAGNMACDLDDDGALSIFDLLAFQDEFSAGCP